MEVKKNLDVGQLPAKGVLFQVLRGMGMDANDFRRIALGLEGAEEGSHMGAAEFRVGGRIIATLASVKQGYGNLMITVEQQAAFAEEMPDVFLPVAGGWGRNGPHPVPQLSYNLSNGGLKGWL